MHGGKCNRGQIQNGGLQRGWHHFILDENSFNEKRAHSTAGARFTRGISRNKFAHRRAGEHHATRIPPHVVTAGSRWRAVDQQRCFGANHAHRIELGAARPHDAPRSDAALGGRRGESDAGARQGQHPAQRRVESGRAFRCDPRWPGRCELQHSRLHPRALFSHQDHRVAVSVRQRRAAVGGVLAHPRKVSGEGR